MVVAQRNTSSFVYRKVFDCGLIIQNSSVYFLSVCKLPNCRLFTDELLRVHYSMTSMPSDPKNVEIFNSRLEGCWVLYWYLEKEACKLAKLRRKTEKEKQQVCYIHQGKQTHMKIVSDASKRTVHVIITVLGALRLWGMENLLLLWITSSKKDLSQA